MGFAHPDVLLRQLSRSQLMGWMAWAAIRGPIGGPRQDWYHENLAMWAGRPYPPEFKPDGEFIPPWAKRQLALDVEASEDE